MALSNDIGKAYGPPDYLLSKVPLPGESWLSETVLTLGSAVIITRQQLRPFRLICYNTFEYFSFRSCSGGQRCNIHRCHCPWGWCYM